MRQEGGALQQYLRPDSPEHVQAILRFRQQEKNLRDTQPPPELDTLPTEQEYESYIEAQGLHTEKEKLKKERELTEALSEAVFHGETEKIEPLRREIWMLSNFTYLTSNTPSKTIEELTREKARSVLFSPVENRGESSKDIDMNEEAHHFEFQIWHSLLGAIRHHLTGQELMNALHVEDDDNTEQTPHHRTYDPLAEFEYRYQTVLREATHYHENRQTDAKAELGNLRLIRDHIYYNLLFPVLARMKHQSEANQKRKIH